MYQEAKHTWNHDTVTDIVITIRDVHTGISTHAVRFPPLGYPHPIADMTVAADRLDLAWRNRNLGPEAELELKAAKSASQTLLNSWAKYTDGIALGDPIIIVEAGFEPTLGEGHPAVKLDQPPTPAAVARSGGFIDARTVKIKGADKYFWIAFTSTVFEITIIDGQIRLPLNSGAIIIPMGGSIETFAGLPPMTEVHVGLIAMNAAGLSPLSTLKKVYTI